MLKLKNLDKKEVLNDIIEEKIKQENETKFELMLLKFEIYKANKKNVKK